MQVQLVDISTYLRKVCPSFLFSTLQLYLNVFAPSTKFLSARPKSPRQQTPHLTLTMASSSPQQHITTSFLLSNLHCPSCVSHIKDVLSCLEPAPLSVAPSLLSSSVTIIHEEALSIYDLQEALEQAGFEICDMTNDSSQPASGRKSYVTSNNDIGYLDRFIHKFPSDRNLPAKSKYPARHIDNCEACRLLDNKDGPSTSSHSLHSTDEDGGKRRKMEKIQTPLVVVPVPGEQFRATMAIGGMTCAACVVSAQFFHSSIFLG